MSLWAMQMPVAKSLMYPRYRSLCIPEVAGTLFIIPTQTTGDVRHREPLPPRA